MRNVLRLCALLFGALLIAATLRNDVVADVPTLEPIADPPLVADEPAPTNAAPTGIKNPFTPYDVGDPNSIWPYESLSAAEQAVIDHERATAAKWGKVHDGYSAAVNQLTRRARGGVAQHDLGVDSIDRIGVVP